MKESNNVNEENISNNKYTLKDSNNDNDIILEDQENNNIEDNEEEKTSSKIKNNKQHLNYSVIVKSVLDNIKSMSKSKTFIDEFKINLLLFSSINDISLKTLCLNCIFRFNEEKINSPILNYIVNKTNALYKNNKNVNIKSFIYILKSYSQILYQRKKYFYAYHFIEKAKLLLSYANNEKESEEINMAFSDIRDMTNKYINSKYELFKERERMSEKKVNDINKILQEIILSKKINVINENDDNNNEEYGSYLFMISRKWVIRAKIFIDYYNISCKEMAEEEFLQKAFNTYNLLNFYFKEENEKNNFSSDTFYPGPINNYNLINYKDYWEDYINDDENYYIKDNLVLNKDYYLITQRNWNLLNEIFDSTNEVKKCENNFNYIILKALILDKRFKEKKNFNLLRRRYIKIKEKIKINKLKEKIIRCINHELKQIKEKKSTFLIDDIDDSDELEELNNKSKNLNINFYIIEKKNRNILIEICLTYANNILIYDSTLLKKIILSEEDSIEFLFKTYDKKKHILIIEINEKNMDTFLQEIKPIINEDKNNLIYQCNMGENLINYEQRYICDKCNMSIFCSKSCANISGDHIQLDKKLTQLLKSNFDLKQFLKRELYLEQFSSKGVVGLANLGNTCYLNSVIQCLSNSLDLTKYFVYDYYKNEENFNDYDYDRDIVQEFSTLIKDLWVNNNQVIFPKSFVITFCKLNPHFQPGMQQDAQEFLSTLFSNLNDRLNRINIESNCEKIEEKKNNENELETSKRLKKSEKMKNDSIIYDLFNGQYMSSTKCSICGNCSTVFEDFNILSLPIPKEHYSMNIKYFSEKAYKTFPFTINNKTTFADLKEKALFYYEDNILQNILNDSGGNFNNLLNEESNTILYNYNNTKIPRFLFYKYIDVIILNKIKMIVNNKKIKDEDKILSLINQKENEIVVYEKKSISNDYINIYITASYFNKNNKLFFFGKSVSNFSYPTLLSFDKNTTIDNKLDEKLKQKFVNILTINDLKNIKDHKIQINIMHLKKNTQCFFCRKTYEESQFCPLEDLFKNKYSIAVLIKEFNNLPIVLCADSKNFYVEKSYLLNNILYINPSSEDNPENYRINIYDCLEKFREEEILEKENKYYCEKCKNYQNAKKKIQIHKLPLYLIIQLKRFKYNNNFLSKYIYDSTKNETFVHIADTLDLKDYVNGLDNNNSMYELYGNVLHMEDHYIAICKNGGRWILYDDDSLSRCNFPQSRHSYLLFYKRKKMN